MAGYRGAYCEEAVPVCEEGHGRCDQGTCVEDDGLAGYHCECRPGYEGPTCSVESVHQDQCQGLCQHGTVCGEGGQCVCPAHYTGTYCQIEPLVSTLYQAHSPCATHTCKHGVCLAQDSAEYTCQCHKGYSGRAVLVRSSYSDIVTVR